MVLKAITRTIWVLSLVSLFTDTASEMLYPIMPLYLRSIGFSVFIIGLLEGLAEATAGLSKGYFGRLSDHTGRRMPFVRLGYTLSALSKPLLALSVYPLWVFFLRTLDRLGKGLRTGARDALLSSEATAATRGTVFGFHRSMDTLGAVLGPLIALIFLQRHPGAYRTLFLIAFLPGMFAIACSFLVRDKWQSARPATVKVPFFSFMHYWREGPVLYKKLVLGLLLFALINSSDVFLLLRIRQSGHSDATVITIYIFYNLVYALSSFPLGMLADRVGLKKLLIAGISLFAIVYFGMAWNTTDAGFYALFLLYGVYAAATEGISKAWISNIVKRQDTATAIGTYSGFQSICGLVASSLAGLIWYAWGAAATFLISAAIAIVAAVYLSSVAERSGPTQTN